VVIELLLLCMLFQDEFCVALCFDLLPAGTHVMEVACNMLYLAGVAWSEGCAVMYLSLMLYLAHVGGGGYVVQINIYMYLKWM